MAVVTDHSFFLSPNRLGVYNSRTVDSGVITTQNSESPIVQIHESDVTGVSTAYGSFTSDWNDSVLETTVPLYLPYDTLKDAVSAASGFEAGSKGKNASEIALAFSAPGSARIAWIGNRKKNFYCFTNTNSGKNAVPGSLGEVMERMLGSESSYAKYDCSYSSLHSVSSVHYATADVDSVKPTKVRIPKWVRPIVCTQAAPALATNGSTVYPPGKYIVIFGFVSMKARNDVPVFGVDALSGGWSFWLKVLVKVVVYALELAAVEGIEPPTDLTPAVWTAPSNLESTQTPPDYDALLVASREFAARARLAYKALATPNRIPLSKKRKISSAV